MIPIAQLIYCLQMTLISKPTRGWKMDPILRRIIQFDKKSQNSVGVTRGTTSPNMSKIRQLSAKIDTSEPLSFFVTTHGMKSTGIQDSSRSQAVQVPKLERIMTLYLADLVQASSCA